MPCIDWRDLHRQTVRCVSRAAACLGVVLAGCATGPGSPPVPVPVSTGRPVPVVVPVAPVERPAAPAVAAGAPAAVRVPAPATVRSANELHLQAARRIAAANPHLIYNDRPPEVLLAIPVLAVDLNADGSIRHIDVLRYPRQAKDTTQIAIDAVRRAAPFGDVSHLPRPWRFTETFLFNDDRRFKPRTLDDR